jgi:enoyl-CoA hydratase
METLETITYGVTGAIARITLNRPDRGNGITLEMPREIAACVERANLDPAVHVIALAGNGSGFCGGYDLVASAEGRMEETGEAKGAGRGRPRRSAPPSPRVRRSTRSSSLETTIRRGPGTRWPTTR